MSFETEFHFTLPRGYVDDTGMLHREGIMRLANAADEILPLRDPRVQQNPSYLTIILLARVIVRLGSLPAVDTKIVEKLLPWIWPTSRTSISGSTPWRPRSTGASAPTAGKRWRCP